MTLMRRWLIFLLLFALLPICTEVAAAAWVDRFERQIQQARELSELPTLERRADLDRVAQRYAKFTVSRPKSERLAQSESIEAYLERGGVDGFRRAYLHLDLGRGYSDWSGRFSSKWRRRSSWNTVIGPDVDAIGVATATADDGWVALVAILVDDLELKTDIAALEQRVLDGINAVRIEQGLSALEAHPRLQRVARSHSDQMAAHDFFSHSGLDGSSAAGRAEQAGIRFETISENIYSVSGVEDPVPGAIRSWWESRGHRQNLLDPVVDRTGIGVAIDADGKYFVTQLFLKERD